MIRLNTGVGFAFALMTSLSLVFCPSIAHSSDFFTSENDDVEDGNELLLEGKTAEALEKYDDAARSLPGRSAVHLNRGLALARSGEKQLDQAMQAFQLASDGAGDDKVSARALSNLGNAFFKKQDFDKAVTLYKQSLMLNPGNKDVAWNLEIARQKKKEQEEQQKKEQEEQQNQDQQNQDQQNQDQQNQDQQNKDEQQDKQEEQDKKDENKDKPEEQKDQQEKQQEEQKQPQEPRTKQEVEQVLDSLDDQQKNLMKQMAKQKGAMMPAGRVKDW